jgi:hypothetical protein
MGGVMGSGTEQSSHVLDHDERRAELVDGGGHVRPQARPCVVPDPHTATGQGHVLTREPARDHVDRADARPVDGGHVPEVRHPREPVREHPRGGGVDLGVRDHVGVEQFRDGQVEPPVPAEQ